MIKYYCKDCLTELSVSGKLRFVLSCPVCNAALSDLPAFETVAQWEKRKGEQYPGTAPVYCFYTEDGEGEAHWHCSTRENAQFFETTTMQIAATEAGAPPDNWMPS